LLTTQYLEEADRLAAGISVIDHGRVIAEGTPDQLKRRFGGDRIEVVVDDPAALDGAARIVGRVAAGEVDVDAESLRI
ncbi:daunorubicin/doxorubicin resistance ABC transporter ATP-binding protein DrrA, partial [Micromonospora aurantiaca]|nr:daunorubicin/doxorubicin resistance ABC transporter ATP-binding protein DrrA [Micromonospora aurantiaca]